MGKKVGQDGRLGRSQWNPETEQEIEPKEWELQGESGAGKHFSSEHRSMLVTPEPSYQRSMASLHVHYSTWLKTWLWLWRVCMGLFFYSLLSMALKPKEGLCSLGVKGILEKPYTTLLRHPL